MVYFIAGQPPNVLSNRVQEVIAHDCKEEIRGGYPDQRLTTLAKILHTNHSIPCFVYQTMDMYWFPELEI